MNGLIHTFGNFGFYLSQLEATVQSRAAESQDIHQITEEYTQRLSTLERKFQQAIRERETLWKQLEVHI
jgi:hypothetical protein